MQITKAIKLPSPAMSYGTKEPLFIFIIRLPG